VIILLPRKEGRWTNHTLLSFPWLPFQSQVWQRQSWVLVVYKFVFVFTAVGGVRYKSDGWPNASLARNAWRAMQGSKMVENAGELITEKTVETVLHTVQSALQGDMEAITLLAVGYLIPAALAILAIFIGYLFASYLSRVACGPVCRRVDPTLGKFIGKVIVYGVLLGVVGAVLSQVGVRLGGLATILAAAGFAIGLAFQGTLSNFAAGVLLLVFRPFKVGDFINAAGVMGKVNEIDLFTTTLDTPDHRRIIVPNSSISGNTIENVRFHLHRRAEVLVGVAYSADIDRTREALTNACLALGDRVIQGEGRGYMVIMSELGSSSVNWMVRAWVASTDFFAARELLTVEVKRQLDSAGITIPFPQMDVHLFREGGIEAESDLGLSHRQRPRLRAIAAEVRRDPSAWVDRAV
jgi:small conductance mechanosensitive channel